MDNTTIGKTFYSIKVSCCLETAIYMKHLHVGCNTSIFADIGKGIILKTKSRIFIKNHCRCQIQKTRSKPDQNRCGLGMVIIFAPAFGILKSLFDSCNYTISMTCINWIIKTEQFTSFNTANFKLILYWWWSNEKASTTILLKLFKGTLIQIWKSANIFFFIWKYVEDFTLKQLLLFETCTRETCEKFVYKHSKRIDYVTN